MGYKDLERFLDVTMIELRRLLNDKRIFDAPAVVVDSIKGVYKHGLKVQKMKPDPPKTLTKAEAKESLAKGERLTHRYFSDSEWVEGFGCRYAFEDGVVVDPESFWSVRGGCGWGDDWKIIPKEN